MSQLSQVTIEENKPTASDIKRRDFEPTHGQVERGLTGDCGARRRWALRMDFTATPEQVERGLTDKDAITRAFWLVRCDFKLTVDQVERGLTDINGGVRLACVMRSDFVPTPEQAERGLKGSCGHTRASWEGRTDLVLSLSALGRVIASLLEEGKRPLPPALECSLRVQAEYAQLTTATKPGVRQAAKMITGKAL